MKIVTALILTLALLAGLSQAAPPTRFTVPADAARHFSNQGLNRDDCVLGNPYEPNNYLTNWAENEIWIQYEVWPEETCACGSGFLLDSFDIRLFGTSAYPSYPVTIPLTVSLESGVWNEERQCWFPSTPDCVAAPVEVTVTEPGVWEFTIPFADACDCAFLAPEPPASLPDQEAVPYLISFRMPTIQSAHNGYQGVFPLIDGQGGQPCTSYWFEENTWWDGYDYFAGYGDFFVRANASCCESPVAAENHTWGEIKAIFR